MRAARSLDQLRGDAHALAGPPYTAFQEVMRRRGVARSSARSMGLAAKGEGRVAGNDEERAEARQASDDVLGDAVAEIGLLGLAAQIIEREDSDGRAVRQSERLAGSARPLLVL